jgi:hypothetical protein
MRKRHRFRHLLSRVQRYVTVGVLLAAYLLASLGFPLPARALKDHSQPFPCQDHACGCQTAEECWHSCCCLTPAEQLAWARQHDVTPPPDARCLTAEEESQGWDSRPRRQREAGQANPSPSCSSCASCERHTASRASEAKSCCSSAGAKAEPAPRPRTTWVIGSLSLRCRGLQTLWMTTGANLPPPAPVQYAHEADPAGWLRPAEMTAFSWTSPPLSPPPRVLS